jgi:hypothetical protein
MTQKEYPHPRLMGAPIFGGAFLAGGAITSAYSASPINDYDFYFKSREDFEEAVNQVYIDQLWVASLTDRAMTVLDGETVIQFMHFDWFETADAIFDLFDFRCNMGAIDCDTMDAHLHPHFLCDIAARTLTFNPKTKFPIASAGRVKKYMERGYTVTRGSMLKIGAACAALNITSWDELKSQLGGVYGEQIELAQANGDFSWDVAFECLQNAEFISSDPQELPDSADKLLAQIFPAPVEAAA